MILSLVPYHPPADRFMFEYGNVVRSLGARSFEVTSTHAVVAHFGNPLKRMHADAAMRDVVDGAKLTLVSSTPDPDVPLVPVDVARYALHLGGVARINYMDGAFTVIAKDAAALLRLTKIVNPDFAGVPVTVQLAKPKP